MTVRAPSHETPSFTWSRMEGQPPAGHVLSSSGEHRWAVTRPLPLLFSFIALVLFHLGWVWGHTQKQAWAYSWDQFWGYLGDHIQTREPSWALEHAGQEPQLLYDLSSSTLPPTISRAPDAVSSLASVGHQDPESRHTESHPGNGSREEMSPCRILYLQFSKWSVSGKCVKTGVWIDTFLDNTPTKLGVLLKSDWKGQSFHVSME